MKRVLFLLGLTLLILAFVATAMELAAHAQFITAKEAAQPSRPTFMSFFAVLQSTAPGLLLRLMDSPPWDAIRLILHAPGWLIFGAPGLALVILAKDRTPNNDDDDLEASLFLYDELAEHARRDALEHPDAPNTSEPDTYGPSDIIPADQRYAENISVDEVFVERDFLITPQERTQRKNPEET